MSILIPGMEMPENDVLELRIYPNGNVYKIIGGYHTYYQPNKAVPVPPHGRLIDADAIEKLSLPMTDIIDGEIVQNRYVSLGTIRQMPTIIPAEEGEG